MQKRFFNLLPYDGEVFYWAQEFSKAECRELKSILESNIEWTRDVVTLFGKKHLTKREVAWYGEKPYTYRYAGNDKVALPWTPVLTTIKERIELLTGETYNSCLLNQYHDGTEGMGWHSDNETMLKKAGAITSVSFGANRDFQFRHRMTKEKKNILLEDGSVLLMKGTIQEHWQHQLPKRLKVKVSRINLTFRTVNEGS